MRGHDDCDALAARGNVRGVSLGVGGGECNAGDGEAGRRGRVRLVDNLGNR